MERLQDESCMTLRDMMKSEHNMSQHSVRGRQFNKRVRKMLVKIEGNGYEILLCGRYVGETGSRDL